MTVFTDDDLNAVYEQKRRIFALFMAVSVLYVLFSVAWLVYYISLPYNDPKQTLPKACVFIASGIYVIFLFPYLGIKYRRVRRYYKMMYFLSEGLKNVEENYFVGFELKDLQKDNVDVISCIFKTWNKKKQEWMEREAYWDPEHALPDFQKNDLVKYVVQSNFILAYEIIERAVPDEKIIEE